MRSSNEEIKKRLDTNVNDIKDLKDHLNTYSDIIQENTDAIVNLRTELSSLREINEELMARNTALEKHVKVLETKIAGFEQNLLDKTVEIAGIPNSANESV
ncbi:hypothetical protein GE061_009991 [Apolygus lucorum]|uniref:Uncharacterized protein n=1 Tax=Apolygus lucorum TaxID=248454 RepID=A0A8S9Y3C1_APOLU|nr:hypothetical protein GE061_009991 [Apolygus lucorum]